MREGIRIGQKLVNLAAAVGAQRVTSAKMYKGCVVVTGAFMVGGVLGVFWSLASLGG